MIVDITRITCAVGSSAGLSWVALPVSMSLSVSDSCNWYLTGFVMITSSAEVNEELEEKGVVSIFCERS
jgi:hypothetical protein